MLYRVHLKEGTYPLQISMTFAELKVKRKFHDCSDRAKGSLQKILTRVNQGTVL